MFDEHRHALFAAPPFLVFLPPDGLVVLTPAVAVDNHRRTTISA